jgi:hypothetical protein
MAQQLINIGTTANDGTGDPLRTAFDKCNDNFTELYAGGGGGGGGIGGNTGSTDNAILRADGTGGSTLQTSGITIADGASGTLSGTNSGDQNIFSTVSAGGQSLVADSTSDTLTLVAGTNVSITADASTDTITISATGGSGGGNVSGPASPTTDNALVRWDGTTGQLIQNSSVTLSDTQEMSGLKSVTFNTAGGTVGLAKMIWDPTNQTIDLGIGAGSVNALLGVDSHVLGRNTTGSTITRGQVVRVNGASAGNLTIALAQGNTDPNTANTIGIASETIANNATGMVITSGLLRDLNTQTFTAGDLLYISATTAGLLVNTIPTAPNHAVRMGYVVSAHPSNGIIYVAVNNGYELNELHDVNYPTTPATNDFLVYVTNRWENQTASTARTSMGLGTLATQSGTFSGTSSGTNTGDQTITLTGDVTGTGTGSFSATIASGAVTNAKMANMTASTIKARVTGSTGSPEDATLTQVLDLVGSAAQGDILYRSASAWTRLGAGTSGHYLKTNGTGANPAWASVTGGGSTNVWIPAAQWIPRTTTGCGIDSRELSTNKINTDELLFDAGTDEFAQCMIVMPSNWNAGTVTAKFHWTASTGSGDVVWGLSGRAYANDDALDQAQGTAQTCTDTLTATNDLDISPATSAITLGGTAAAGNPVIFEVYRDANAGGDTLAADARLLGVEITYTAA